MVPSWIPSITWHLIFRVPKKGTIILAATYILIALGFRGQGVEEVRAWTEGLRLGIRTRVNGLGWCRGRGPALNPMKARNPK